MQCYGKLNYFEHFYVGQPLFLERAIDYHDAAPVFKKESDKKHIKQSKYIFCY